MRLEKGWSTAVVVIDDEENVVLIKNEQKPTPHYWKFPGGRKEIGETPEETALRELQEETGISVSHLCLLHKEDRGNHDVYYYGMHVHRFEKLKEKGDEGELVSLFPLHEIEEMVDFFEPHRKVFNEILKRKESAK